MNFLIPKKGIIRSTMSQDLDRDPAYKSTIQNLFNKDPVKGTVGNIKFLLIS